MFPFDPSRQSRRRASRSLTRTTRQMTGQLTRSLESAAKSVTKSAAKSVTKAVTRSTEQAMREARKATIRSVKRTVRDTEKAVAAAVTRQGVKQGVEVARKPPGQFVTVDGLPVHVIVRGRGRPVVLVHGNGTMAEDFAICGLIDRLAARYRVIAIDRPGFGYSGRPRHRIWTAQAQAVLLHRVLEQLGVERPLIVGHSWGTIVALALAADGRRPLRGLVLLSGSYFPGHRTDAALIAPLAVPGLGDAMRAMVPAKVSASLTGQSFRQVFWPQPVPARFTARFSIEIAAAATQLRAVSEDAASMSSAVTGLQRRYAGLTLPVSVLAGDADAIVKASEHSVRLHTTIPGSTLRLLPGLGHMIHYGARLKVERAIDDLMKLR
ncbi:alpha/beta fold hydrolase [Methylorubrum extorquens]|uniref:alpha/beta fold hydrolase n=1 Tax=Methylorubrum extorquens TaxID=408 RepID=UPI000158F334|nr:alpha/beta hydrolase [Methylorubrum extorquens]ABY32020.1 alpha/beta hydrolase fold [Methylorubrum extorquens PA1]KQP93945.1 alpha/beta hydrolase [Methylobacterium sp. Leaf119]WIU38632.1 alpha/beta hydrolase [Methylorubrum extorquens]